MAEDDETILAQVNDSIKRRQAVLQSSADSEPSRLICGIVQRLERIDSCQAPTADEVRAAQERAAERKTAERERRWRLLAARLGRRYAEAKFDSFIADSGPQRLVLEHARDYADKIAINLHEGRSVLLYGPPGTGKDHLATAIMRAAILDAGATVEWCDGADFYGAMRDGIDGRQSESLLLSRFREPALLAISDPVPPLGAVESSWQLSMLFRVVDRRYRDQKATLMTLNVATRTEAEQRLSPNIIDRLGHGALALNCNWSSFRRAAPQESPQ